MSRLPGALRRAAKWLNGAEDAASLGVLRWTFGGVLVWHLARYLTAHWPKRYYFSDAFVFHYFGFGWVPRVPEPWMHGVFYVSIAAACLVTIGAAYRVAALALCLGNAYIFLLTPSHYMNHNYLIVLFTVWLVTIPGGRVMAWDAFRRPATARRELPKWPRAWLRFQIALVYFLGGVAKLNRDWIFYQVPLNGWLRNRARDEESLQWLATDAAAQTIAWGGLAFDLLVGPALLWRKTRLWVLPVVLGFHLANSQLFRIGVFPWMMILLTPVFFEPDWPRRIPVLGRWIGRWVDSGQPLRLSAWAKERRTALAFSLAAAVQIALPLRHWVYPGDVVWTEEGHRYAWRMKLRSKRGRVRYRVVAADGQQITVNPKDELSPRQVRKLVAQPELIRQYAWHLRERYASGGMREPKVYADAFCGVNYRKLQRFIDPEVDLASEPATLAPYGWILPWRWSPP